MDFKCNCGATIPEGSQFCTMCGRPLSKEARQAEAEQAKAFIELSRRRAAGEEEPEKRPIGFGNPAALRSSYLGALLAAFLSNVPLLHLLCFVWYPATGFLSVYLYRRRTGESPTPREGASLFLLSLAGLPGTSGFVTRFISMSAAIGNGQLLSVLLMGVASVLLFAAYLRILTAMYMRRVEARKVELPALPSVIALSICAIATLYLGFFPGPGPLPIELLEIVARASAP